MIISIPKRIICTLSFICNSPGTDLPSIHSTHSFYSMETSLLCNAKKFNNNQQLKMINLPTISSKRNIRLTQESQPQRKKQRIETKKSHTAPPIDNNINDNSNDMIYNEEMEFITNCKVDNEEEEQDMIKPSYPFTQSASPQSIDKNNKHKTKHKNKHKNKNKNKNPTVTVLSSYDHNDQQIQCSAPPKISDNQYIPRDPRTSSNNNQQSINLNIITTNIEDNQHNEHNQNNENNQNSMIENKENIQNQNHSTDTNEMMEEGQIEATTYNQLRLF